MILRFEKIPVAVVDYLLAIGQFDDRFFVQPPLKDDVLGLLLRLGHDGESVAPPHGNLLVLKK